MPSVPTPRPCVCGGAIAPTADTEYRIAAAVAAHNRSQAHRVWRARHDLDRGPIARPAAAADVDTGAGAALRLVI